MWHQRDGVTNLLVLLHVFERIGIVTHAMIDDGFSLGTIHRIQFVSKTKGLFEVAVHDVVVHLHEGFQRTDAIWLLQERHLLIDAVELFLVILLESHLTETVQGPAFMDGCYVRLVDDLTCVGHAGLGILTVIGNLHQLLQVFASTLVGEVLVAKVNGFQECFFGSIVVLLL